MKQCLFCNTPLKPPRRKYCDSEICFKKSRVIHSQMNRQKKRKILGETEYLNWVRGYYNSRYHNIIKHSQKLMEKRRAQSMKYYNKHKKDPLFKQKRVENSRKVRLKISKYFDDCTLPVGLANKRFRPLKQISPGGYQGKLVC